VPAQAADKRLALVMGNGAIAIKGLRSGNALSDARRACSERAQPAPGRAAGATQATRMMMPSASQRGGAGDRGDYRIAVDDDPAFKEWEEATLTRR